MSPVIFIMVLLAFVAAAADADADVSPSSGLQADRGYLRWNESARTEQNKPCVVSLSGSRGSQATTFLSSVNL